MKTQISTSFLASPKRFLALPKARKLLAFVLFSSLLFTQAKVQAQCVANWNWATQTISGCNVNFTNTSTGTNTTTSYNWDFGDSQASNLQTPSHTYSVSGTYSVCLTIIVPGGLKNCSSTVCKNVTVQCGPTGIASSEQIDISLSVTNPVFSSTDIHYSIPSSGNVEFVLFDVVGNKIGVIENAIKSAGMHSYTLSTGGFSKGIYFLHLNFEGATPPEDGFVHLANITQKIIIAE